MMMMLRHLHAAAADAADADAHVDDDHLLWSFSSDEGGWTFFHSFPFFLVLFWYESRAIINTTIVF